MKTRFPEVWARETKQAHKDPASRRIMFGHSPDLPPGFEMELATTVNGEVVASEAPLLLRDLRGLMIVNGEPKTINSYDMDGQFEPRRSETRYWDECYSDRISQDLPGKKDSFPEGVHFGLCQVDDHLEFTTINVGKDAMTPDRLVVYMRPIFYRSWEKDKLLRYGKSLTLQMVHVVDGFYGLGEWLHIVFRQDFGPLRKAGLSRGVARYYRRYFNVRVRHYLEVGFRLDEDWKLRPMLGRERNGVDVGGGPEPPDPTYPDRQNDDLMKAYGNIYLAHESISAHDICGSQILSNPPAQILDLLTNKG